MVEKRALNFGQIFTIILINVTIYPYKDIILTCLPPCNPYWRIRNKIPMICTIAFLVWQCWQLSSWVFTSQSLTHTMLPVSTFSRVPKKYLISSAYERILLSSYVSSRVHLNPWDWNAFVWRWYLITWASFDFDFFFAHFVFKTSFCFLFLAFSWNSK